MTEIEIVQPGEAFALDLHHYEDPTRNPALVYLGKLGEGSRPAMRGALEYLAGWMIPGATIETFPWHVLRYRHTALIRSHLMQREIVTSKGRVVQSAANANKQLSALRGVLKEAWRLGQMDTDDYMRAVDLPNIAGGADELTGRMMSMGEQIAIFAACSDSTAAGARDAAMFAVAIGLGLRRAEIAHLALDDYNPFESTVTVRRGKRNKTRTAYMPPGVIDAVNWWIRFRGQEPGPLFPHINKGGRIVMRGLCAESVQKIFDKRSEQAKVRKFTPHDLRRTYISTLLDNGIDLATVQKMAGHANTATTARYDRRPAETRRKAARSLHVPFERPQD